MRDFRKNIKRMSTEMRHFHSLQFGEYELSIQASDAHYCRPKKYFSNPYAYESFEIALFKDDEWINLSIFSEFSDMGWENSNIQGWVKPDKIQKLCDRLEAISSNSAYN